MNWLRDETPDQSGHLSCSMENERSVFESGCEFDGEYMGTDTSTPDAARDKKIAESARAIERRMVNSKLGTTAHKVKSTTPDWL